ncbi:MAG TPA: pseudouridine-5'-phosphate glycosidase [Vicinamibacteria bacterium]|nr:pseudouridine-5'-phosphate glycosidase [Vicinamibacteria bacterium]
MSPLLRVSDEVARALGAHGPVVALETTVVTHGLPHPEGLRVAAELEAEVRGMGAVPATIGVLDGRVCIGLTVVELARLAEPPAAPKLNLSNLAVHVAGRGRGSTTVAATIQAAHAAGIAVMATGGIGGVHRDVAQTGDVSGDLGALARYPVAVVCAGAKAVLDIPRTLEMLETLGVPVIGFATDRFPAFYRRDSGSPVDGRCDDVDALAGAVGAHLSLGLGTGIVVAHPVPASHEMPRETYEAGLAGALEDAARAGVRGREVTPFLLERLRERTAGASVFSNTALLRANARLAGQLAAALARRA